MSVLDSFVAAMLQPESDRVRPKMVLIERLIHGLAVEKPPQFKVPAPPYTFESKLYGFTYDYTRRVVRLSYKVTHSVYPDMTVSFATFRALLEGLAVCIRMQKW